MREWGYCSLVHKEQRGRCIVHYYARMTGREGYCCMLRAQGRGMEGRILLFDDQGRGMEGRILLFGAQGREEGVLLISVQ